MEDRAPVPVNILIRTSINNLHIFSEEIPTQGISPALSPCLYYTTTKIKILVSIQYLKYNYNVKAPKTCTLIKKIESQAFGCFDIVSYKYYRRDAVCISN